MKKLLDKLVKKAKKDKDILAVSVFGSYARGEPHKDIDVCLFLNRKKTNLQMTNKRLAYLSAFSFDIQIFQQLPIVIKQRILKEGRMLLCKDTEKLYDIAYLTAKEYEDFIPVYDDYIGMVEYA